MYHYIVISTHVCVGVRSQYRRQGIGRHLMGHLFRHVAGLPTCQLVYLHVLATNTQALGECVLHIKIPLILILTIVGHVTVCENLSTSTISRVSCRECAPRDF